MSLIQQLSSQAHVGLSSANLAVAKQCLANPALLEEIAANLNSGDKCLSGDCAEVLTMTAQEQPELVAPYAELLCPLLRHKAIRVRWESAHALALTAYLRPEVIAGLLPELAQMIEDDTSVIVRDYSVDVIANYARTGADQARAAFPLLKRATVVWAGKHAGHALTGLAQVAANAPELKEEIVAIAKPFLEDKRGVVRKAAGRVVASCELRVGKK